MCIRFIPMFPSLTVMGFYNHDLVRVNGRWKSQGLLEESSYASLEGFLWTFLLGGAVWYYFRGRHRGR
jgi:hypothetical protein